MRRPLVAIALTAASGWAQPNEATARLRWLDSLAAVRLEELRANDRAEVEARRQRPMIVEGVHLLVDSALVEVVSTGFRLGLQDVRARGASWASRILADLDIRVVLEGDAFSAAGGISVVATSRDKPALSAATPAFARDASGLRHATTAMFDRLLRNSLDLEMGAWLAPVSQGTYVHGFRPTAFSEDASFFGPVDASGSAWATTRLHAARTPSESTRQCLTGSARACALSLGIQSGPAAPVSTWYAPPDFRWVSARVSRDVDSTRRRDLQGCDAGNLDACERFVASAPPGSADAPLALAQPRQALVMLALDAGGPDAVDRLIASRGTIVERIEHAAGRPLDSLLVTYGKRVAAKPAISPQVHPLALLVAALVAASLLVSPRRSA